MNRKVLGLAVVAALTAGTAANAGNQILFPFFKQGNGVHTILSVVNTNDTGNVVKTFTQPIHTVYMFKRSEADLADTCTHIDQYSYMSDNDLMQWTAQDPQEGGLDIIGNNQDQSKPFYLPKSVNKQTIWTDQAEGFVIMAPKRLRADLVPDADGNVKPVTTNMLYGFANLFDTTTGLSYAYHAVSNDFNTTNEGNFVSDGANKAPFGASSYVLTWNNTSSLDANWYVLVPSANMAGFRALDADYRAANEAAVGTKLVDTIAPGLTNNGVEVGAENLRITPYGASVNIAPAGGVVFNNDEVPLSANISMPEQNGNTLTIVCNGVITLRNLVDPDAYANGGWMKLDIQGNADYEYRNGAQITNPDKDATALIWKVDSVLDTANLGWGANKNRSITSAPENQVLRSGFRSFQ